MAGSAVIGALRVDLSINSAEFTNGLRRAQQNLAGFGKSMQSVGRSMSAYLTVPIMGFAALTAKTAGDFEASMNRVGAATGATGAELASMSDLARQLGQDTSKSASESADMMEMLAKNGLSAKQILDGAAASAIALSEATGADLSRSADVATNVMAQFNMEVKDLPRIVDQITASTLDSQFGFEDYALALGQAGGVAGGLGVSLSDFNTVITATADTFNSGSDAGTSFKTFLLSLSPTTNKAAGAMQRLGLEFYNVDGSLKSMAEVAEELRQGMSGLSDEALNMDMHTIFGTDAMRTAIALMNQGAEGLNKVQEGINRQGVAAEQQAARMRGFNGEMEKLRGAFENLQLAIADSGLLSAITQFVTQLAGWVESLAKTNPELLKWGTIIAGVTAALGPLLIAVGALATGIAAIGAPIALAVAAFGTLVAGIAYFKPEIQAAVDAINAFEVKLNEFVAGAWAAFEAAWDGMVQKVQAVKASIVQFAQELPAIFAALPAQMLEIGGQIIDGLWNGLKNKFGQVKEGLTNFASGLVDTVRGIWDTHSPSRVMQQIGSDLMQGLDIGIGSKKEQVLASVGDIANGITDTAEKANGAFDGIFSGIGSSIAEVIKGTKTWKEALSDVLGQLAQIALSNFTKSLGGGGGGFLGSLFSGLLGGGLTGFATGGSFTVGGSGGLDSQVRALRLTPGEKVSVSRPGDERNDMGGVVNLTQNFPIQGAISDKTVISMVRQGANEAVTQVKRNFQGWQVELQQTGGIS